MSWKSLARLGAVLMFAGGVLGVASFAAGQTLNQIQFLSDAQIELLATSTATFNISTRPTTGGAIHIYTRSAGTGIFIASSTNNVGIGTTQPLDELDVYQGDIGLGRDAGVEHEIVFRASDDSRRSWIFGMSSSTVADDYIGFKTTYGSIRFVTNGGNEVVRITDNERVGIGTTTPAKKLHVESGGANSAIFSDPITIGYTFASTDAARKDYVDNNFAPLGGASGVWQLSGSNLYASSTSWNVGIGTSTPATLFAVATTTNIFNVLSSGKVGIGTASPEQALDVVGVIRSRAGSHQFRIYDTDTSAEEWSLTTFNNANFGIYEDTTTNRFSILAGGNVGIGTPTPGTLFTLNQSAAGNLVEYRTSYATPEVWYLYEDSGGLYWKEGSDFRFMLKDGGNVGIGTTTPAKKLHVESGGANSAIFSDPITIGYPASSTDAARKDYVDNNFAPLGGASGVWQLSGSNLYASSTSWNVGVGTAAPAGKLGIVSDSGSNATFLHASSTANYGNDTVNFNSDFGGWVFNIRKGWNQKPAVFRFRSSSTVPYTQWEMGTSDSDQGWGSGDEFYISPTLGGGATSTLWLEQNGNVGIGVSAPSYKFQVNIPSNSSAATNGAHFGQGTYGLSIVNNTGSGFGPRIIGVGEDSSDAGLDLVGSIEAADDTGAIPAVTIDGRQTGAALATRPILGVYSYAGTMKFTIASSGYVGVNQPTPIASLDVQGGVNAAAATSGSAGNSLLRLEPAGTDALLDVGFNSGTPVHAWIQPRFRTNYATNYNLALNPNGGNVGIGTSTPQHALSINGTYYAVQYSAGNSGTAKTIDWNSGNTQHVTMTGNVTFTFSNGQPGGRYTLILKQDGTGGHTAVWPGTVRWGNTGAPTLSTAASATDYVTFIYNGVDAKYDGLAFTSGF
ncbi:MAG: hypothetical protein V1885_03270 [Candidatus Brennerbacteria bacterium]